ncbi:MAG: BamA/TamA family outer membrane protein, partial [Sinomicrobium sp.]|nr:BamA/TamA family outer membrane protein [Sinomicrobium sp.]
TPYKVHTIKDVNVYVDCTDADDSLKTVTYKEYTLYYKDKLHYKPKALTDNMVIRSGAIYSDADRSLTNRQIGNLRMFKYPNINYKYADSARALLAASIYLNSRPRFSVGFESDISHSNIQDFGISFSTSVISRNVFRGAETVELSARGTLGSSKEANDAEDKFFNISEIGADLKLNFPRFFFLFNTDKIIPKYMSPATRISLGTTVQTNIGLDKQSFNDILRYAWNPGNFTRNALELFNIQFIRNVNADNFFNVYENPNDRLVTVAINNGVLQEGDERFETPQDADNFIADVLDGVIVVSDEEKNEVRRIDELKTRLTDNNLIMASNFTYTRNNRAGATDNDFSQFRTKVELAGNLLSAFAGPLHLKKNEDDHYELFKVAYSQYVKTEFDYIKYWSFSADDILAFRSFLGIAVPYGNSDNIPFSRSYFGGGSNDNRAWEAYALGPGSAQALNDFNEANLKLAFNLEYRFNIFGSFNGALFADAGNIWNIWDNVEDENATFSSLSSLKDIALGTGFGIRYDFGFFVLRFDTGFKTYDPAYETGRRWFTDYNFANAVFNIGINYPF